MPFAAPLIGPLVGGIASAGAGALFSNLFGGSGTSASQLNSQSLTGINAGGLSTTFTKGKGKNPTTTVGVTADPVRKGLVGSIAATFPQQAALLAGLRASVAPGSSALRASRLAEIENARRSAISDLRANLGRRRILGSSFASDAITRAELGFAQQRDKAAAESFMSELELTAQLQEAEFAAKRGEFQTALNEMNLEADTAAQIASGFTAQAGANARAAAQLDATAQAGAGKFFSPIIDQIGSTVSSGISNWLNPGSGSWGSAFFAPGT